MVLASCSLNARQADGISVIPCPQSVNLLKGTFRASGAAVNCDPSLDAKTQQTIQRFASQLFLASGKPSSFAATPGIVETAKAGNGRGFVFCKDSSLEPEEYTINIQSKCAIVSASDFNGFLYAIQTLKQLLPPAIYSKDAGSETLTLQCMELRDKPRFRYRGMHLDVARHFFPVEEVKKYLDIMATFKLNRFHFHLTDDQGWRIEIKKYPLLTEIGGYRSGTMVGRDFSSDDGITYGGFYTQEQIKEIISYADQLGITVIPEIDLPGHMLAALSAYPELGCTGGPYEAWHKWGIAEQVLCPGKPKTLPFLRDVLDEIADLFPSEYIHIGGDECPKVEWEKCPDCQALIQKLDLEDKDGVSAEQFLQNYIMTDMQNFLATKGKRIIGWDEILEGNLAEGATLMYWRGGHPEVANSGYDVIMVPTDYFYFDYYQVKDKEKAPVSIGGYLPLENVYSFEPLNEVKPENMDHILGVQANLWTEYIPSNEHLEYMLLPRMLALCEDQWCTPENKDYDRFLKDVIEHEFKVFDVLGYSYCKEVIGDPAL